MSVAEYETDRESLRRMLADFQSDYLAKHKVHLSICFDEHKMLLSSRGLH